MSRPIIYFGPPKTSTSFIYYALCGTQGYLQTAVKEWRYLRSLYLFGSLGYTERLGVFHGTQEYHSMWQPIHHSYVEHLKTLENKPTNHIVLKQLKHSQALIFERHKISSYLKLFDDIEDFFRFDLDPLNHTVSSNFLKRLVNACPEALFISGMRPFLPHLTSLIFELFVWFDQKHVGTLENPIKNFHADNDLIKDFQDDAAFLINELLNYYLTSNAETVEEIYLNKSIAFLSEKSNQPDRHALLALQSIILYLHTNVSFRLQKLGLISGINDSVYYYYSPNISRGFFELVSWIQSKGVKADAVETNFTIPRTRGANRELVARIFESNQIMELVLSCERAASNFHLGKIHESLHELIFPKIKFRSDSWFDMCRKIDDASQITTIESTWV